MSKSSEKPVEVGSLVENTKTTIKIKPTAKALAVTPNTKMGVVRYLQLIEVEQVWADLLMALYPRTVMTKAQWDQTLMSLMNKKIIS